MLADYTSAPIPKAERRLFAFVAKVNQDAENIGPEDLKPLREAGWSDEAVYDAVMVCALFNFYNRWIAATGVHEMTAEGHRLSGRRMALRGYLISEHSATTGR